MNAVRRQELVSSSRCPDRNSFSGSGAPLISLVVPAYCEEESLAPLYREVSQVMTSLEVAWEMIVIDDGSTDGTWQQIRDLHQADQRVKGLRLSRNFGHQYALLAGLANATGRGGHYYGRRPPAPS